MTVLESDLERMWNLVCDLSSQLTQNRQRTDELQQRADELKAQAVHQTTGYTLRRFNVDVSQEEFDSDLEKLNVNLVQENQTLQQENRALSALLKDYESTLEAVMSKFRAHAHSTQLYHLELVKHYEAILLASPSSANGLVPSQASSSAAAAHAALQAASPDPDLLAESLQHVSQLLRKALRAMNGEDPESSASPFLGAVFGAGDMAALAAAAGGAAGEDKELDSSEDGSVDEEAEKEAAQAAEAATKRRRALPKDVDDALEREIELERLVRENAELRAMLGIAEDHALPSAAE